LFVITAFRATPGKGPLRGWATVAMPSGMVLNDCGVFAGDNDTAWASPPSKPQISRDGMVVKGPDGKTKYSACIEFSSRDARNRWSEQVVAAMRASHPDVFA
jgi:hypothetical protein